MSLSRTEAGGTALTVINLDSVPTKTAMGEINQHPAISNAVLVKF
jgi:D-3-phosphoglycerate dehydrogenase / 2-oxoglutarate reductase